MKEPVIPSQFLSEDPEAARLHAVGLQAQLAGDHDQALATLNTAAAILEGRSSLSRQVQLARIARDTGFTYVRQAVSSEVPALLDDSEGMLGYSQRLTEAAMEGNEFICLTDAAAGGSIMAREMRREVLAEHGATLSLLGRSATVRAVLLDVDTRGRGETARHKRTEEQRWYDRNYAHGYLKEGNNGYYLVSNAVHGARQEILNGQRLRAGKWLVRAVEGLAWTTKNDRRNLAPAQKTFADRLPSLRSYEAAKASVLAKP
ncbi:MAG TPA: hypothetical protein VHC21_02630 [Candidatus Saccharimonadales bacterium]|nr:hypothetical protein [Candidatus Saccharimonadales bacterium]